MGPGFRRDDGMSVHRSPPDAGPWLFRVETDPSSIGNHFPVIRRSERKGIRMTGEAEQAIERAKRLLEDAELFHLTSIPLPVKIVKTLLALADKAEGQGVPAAPSALP
jgi:hypothetical protein